MWHTKVPTYVVYCQQERIGNLNIISLNDLGAALLQGYFVQVQ